jgi:hypothetical protein
MVQDMLVAATPDHFFVPPYVGHLGWLGVRLDRDLDWDEIAAHIHEAYVSVAPRSLAAAVSPNQPT